MEDLTKAYSMTFKTRREKCSVEIYRKHSKPFALTQNQSKAIERNHIVSHLIGNFKIKSIRTIKEVCPSTQPRGYFVQPRSIRRDVSLKSSERSNCARDMYRSLREYTMAQQRCTSTLKKQLFIHAKPPAGLSEATQILTTKQNIMEQMILENRSFLGHSIHSHLPFTRRMTSQEHANPFSKTITPTLRLPTPEHKLRKKQERGLIKKVKSNSKLLIHPAETFLRMSQMKF